MRGRGEPTATKAGQRSITAVDELSQTIARPVTDSVAVESSAFGWPPATRQVVDAVEHEVADDPLTDREA